MFFFKPKDVATKAVETAAEQLMKQVRGRTPNDQAFQCVTVDVPSGRKKKTRGEVNKKQRVRICIESGWSQQSQIDPTTGAPVTIHLSPEITKKQLKEAIKRQLGDAQKRENYPPERRRIENPS